MDETWLAYGGHYALIHRSVFLYMDPSTSGESRVLPTPLRAPPVRTCLFANGCWLELRFWETPDNLWVIIWRHYRHIYTYGKPCSATWAPSVVPTGISRCRGL